VVEDREALLMLDGEVDAAADDLVPERAATGHSRWIVPSPSRNLSPDPLTRAEHVRRGGLVDTHPHYPGRVDPRTSIVALAVSFVEVADLWISIVVSRL